MRVEYAVKHLKENKLFTIDHIAETSGFNSRSTFYRAIQNIYGMTPSQYLEVIILIRGLIWALPLGIVAFA